ncbi:MAG: MASE3 domain-containing protein, partial [Alphaproteobacteria bacterium]
MMEVDLSKSAGTSTSAANKITQYSAVGLGLFLLYLILRGSDWLGTLQLHTLMEVAGAILAIIIGVLALTSFYSQKDRIFLFVGTGFLGSFFLDGYHALVTSKFFAHYLPSELPTLIPWSWIASRQFLAIMLFLGWLVSHLEKQRGPSRQVSDRTVYRFSIILTVASFVFFAFFPLPRAYYPDLVVHRPEEIAAALFFG